jgi:hypothetical protein
VHNSPLRDIKRHWCLFISIGPWNHSVEYRGEKTHVEELLFVDMASQFQAGLKGGEFNVIVIIDSFLPFIGPHVPFHEKGSKLLLGGNNRCNHRFRDAPSNRVTSSRPAIRVPEPVRFLHTIILMYRTVP